LGLSEPLVSILALFAVALTWFLINTVTLAAAISMTSNESFRVVWTNGINLYLLNFIGSAAVAGLIYLFFEGNSLTFLLALPIAAVLYQLYRFYIDKIEGAEQHVRELRRTYLQ